MYSRRKTVFLLLFFSSLFSFPVAPAHAQFDSSNETDRVIVSMTPRNPAPGEYVLLSAASPFVDLEQSDITWYANQKVISEGKGLLESSVIAGPAGSGIDVVVIARSGNTSATGEAFIRPTEVDLVWESDSYTPPFYKWGALPSAGTKLKMHALARLILPDGSSVPENEIKYTWKRNGFVVPAVSGIGRSFAVFPSPTLFSTDSVEVEAVTADGQLAGGARVNISSIEPLLKLYENHPLFGILYNKAFGQTTPVKDAEMTFAAVPYFAQAGSPDDAELAYKWQINGRNIPADYARPSEVTINSNNSSGEAFISLSLTRARSWSMRANGAWSILFPSGRAGASGENSLTPAQQ